MVELRFFGGLSVDETAEVLHVSSITVMREWKTRQSLAVPRADRRHREWIPNAGTTSIELLQSALDRPAAERDVFLRRACGGDQQLEDDVRSLLAAHDRADSFLAAPAIDLAARQPTGRRGGR